MTVNYMLMPLNTSSEKKWHVTEEAVTLCGMTI